MWINVQNEQSIKSLCIMSWKNSPLRHVTPKRPVPGSNNSIHSQDSSPNTCKFHRVLARVRTNRMFMVRGSRLMISFAFKVIFFIWKQFHVDLTWSDYSMNKCNMKWTSHHCKFAIHEVSFYPRLKVVLLKLLSIHDGAVAMMDLDIIPQYMWFEMWSNNNIPIIISYLYITIFQLFRVSTTGHFKKASRWPTAYPSEFKENVSCNSGFCLVMKIGD